MPVNRSNSCRCISRKLNRSAFLCIAAVGVVGTAHAQTTFTSGSGFTLNGGATLNAGTLTLTNGANSEARSAFSNSLVGDTSFTASFTYTPSTSGADGSAFVLQDDSRGPTALGAAGGSLGYGGASGTAISPSAAIEFNIYSGSTQGTAFATDGSTGTYKTTGSVNVASGDPIAVTLAYNGTLLQETLVDTATSATYSTAYSANLSSVLGSSTAYVGFTGATGGVASTQTVSNFSLTTGGTVTASYAAPVALTGYNFAGIANATTAPSGQSAIAAAIAASTGPSTVHAGNLDSQFVYYAQGFDSGATTTGLPVGTTIHSGATNTFTNTTAVDFAIGTASVSTPTPNMLLEYSGATSNTLSLATPGSYSGLALLETGFNGSQTVNYQLNYTNGTDTTGSFTALDNFNGANAAFVVNGRVGVTGSFDSVSSGNPRLYEADITNVNSSLTLASITFFNSNLSGGGTYGIFAVSGISAGTASSAAPEPGSIALLALSGLPLIGALARRRRKA